MEVLPGDAIVAPKMPLGLVPEVFDSVDVVALIGEQLGVADPHVVELRSVEHIVAAKGIGIDHTVSSDLLANDRNKCAGGTNNGHRRTEELDRSSIKDWPACKLGMNIL